MMPDFEWKQLQDTRCSQMRRQLLRTKGGPLQREFLESVSTNNRFVDWIRDRAPSEGSRQLPLCPHPLTEDEFKHPPSSTEDELYQTWSALEPRIACRSSFWANVTLAHIEHGVIQAGYLASDHGGGSSGQVRIDSALHEGSEKAIDACVRTVLRRLGGLPEVRGNRTVYSDCSFGRAWWRERLVGQMSGGSPERAQHVRSVVRISSTYWEHLVDLLVSRNSVLGSENIRNTLILSIADMIRRFPRSPVSGTSTLRNLCRMVARLQASRELSVLDRVELRAPMDEIVELSHIRAIAYKHSDAVEV